MDQQLLLKRITLNPKIFCEKPIIRGRRLAVEHVLGCWPRVIGPMQSSMGIHGWNGKISMLAGLISA